MGLNKKIRYFIDCTYSDSVFKIGHSKFVSETFIPKSHFDEKSGMTFADMASVVNTDDKGNLTEIVNNFLINQMFAKSRRVRFIVPVPFDQVIDGRGEDLKK